MYKNINHANKWFYAFITNIEYVNENLTNIYITTDVWQTWQFDITFKESFVEREMIDVSKDVPGANLLPEGLETGEYKVGGTAEFDDLETVNIIAYSGDKIPIGPTGSVVIDIEQGGYVVNGIASSVVFLIVENSWYNIIMNSLQKETYSEYIVSCFTVPKLAVSSFMIDENKLPTFDAPIYILQNGKNYNQPVTSKQLISTPNNLDNYIPVNQKLRTYPYLYLAFNPTNGSSKIFRYEDFANGTPVFKIMSEVNPSPNVVFIPQNYRGQSGDSLQDLVALNGYPTLSSRTDFYNSWLAQNSEIINLQMEQEQYNYQIGQYETGINGVQNMIGSLLSGNIGGAFGIVNTSMQLAKNDVNHDYYIKNQMAIKEQQKLIPDTVNLSSSNATLLGYNMIDKNIFTRYTIKKEFAKRIDDFFSMYGYLTNELKIPNINNRPNWNYVKLIGSNITGNIPQEDLNTIQSFFDNGITLWHNSATYLDYSQNNR